MVFMITLFGVSVNHLNACTRVVYQGDNNMIITGRTMDWKEVITSIEASRKSNRMPFLWKNKAGTGSSKNYIKKRCKAVEPDT